VLFAWVFFRAVNFTTAFTMIEAMAGHNGVTLPSAAARLETIAPGLVHALGISFGGLTYVAGPGPLNLVWLPLAALVCLAAPNLASWLSPWRLALDVAPVKSTGGLPAFTPDARFGIAIGMLLAFCAFYQQSTIQFLYFQF